MLQCLGFLRQPMAKRNHLVGLAIANFDRPLSAHHITMVVVDEITLRYMQLALVPRIVECALWHIELWEVWVLPDEKRFCRVRDVDSIEQQANQPLRRMCLDWTIGS